MLQPLGSNRFSSLILSVSTDATNSSDTVVVNGCYQLLPVITTSSPRVDSSFLLHSALRNTDCAVTRCPSVRLLHASILSKQLSVSSDFVTIR